MRIFRFFCARAALGCLVLLGPASLRPAAAEAAGPPPEWSWRELGPEAWSPWISAPRAPLELAPGSSPRQILEALGLAPGPGVRAVEMRGRQRFESGEQQRVVLWRAPEEATTLPARRAAPRSDKRAIASAQGRLLYLDRIFDLSGYTGAVRRLPLRQVHIELVRAVDESLMVSGSTDADGYFLLEYDAVDSEDLQLRLLSRIEGHVGDAPRVLDSAGAGGDLQNAAPVPYPILDIVGMGPGTMLDIGQTELAPEGSGDILGAFNLLDLLLDTSQMLQAAEWLGAAPDSLPPLIWSPENLQLKTLYVDGLVRVASPGGGDDDSWADARVLAAIGEWYLDRYARVDSQAGSDAYDLPNDPRRAYAKGAAAVFAALVRQHRARTRLDVDGAPVDAEVSTQVDLGFAPPVGFPGSAQDGFDLETRALSFGGKIDPRGQSSIANVAAMLWDLVDDESTPDGLVGDDDPRRDALVDGAARFHLHAAGSVPTLPPGEAITYEDFHDAWAMAHGEDAALDSIAVTVGRTALFEDAFEDDDDPQLLSAQSPWAQPAPPLDGGVVLSEIQLGDRDWVEISNTGPLPVSLEGWRVVARRNGFSAGPERESLLPAGVALSPGRQLVILEGGDSSWDDVHALHDPDWQVPWREGADGACILYDDGGVAVDFVRWDAEGEPSTVAIPPGLAFVGSLDSPTFAHTLSRDSLGTDTDQALDFVEALPNPYAPNAPSLQLHSLRPAQESDHLRLQLDAERKLMVLATAERDSPQPEIALLDGIGGITSLQGPRPGDGLSALFSWTSAVSEERAFRLTQDADPLIATAVVWGAWIPWDSATLLAVEDFRAVPRNEDPVLDQVDLSWTNASPYDSLRLFVDDQPQAVLAGFETGTSLALGAGHHRFEVEPVQNEVTGSRSLTGVFVGPTPRFFATGFEAGDSNLFDYQGFTELEEITAGGRALLDHPNPAELYPPDDEAVAELRDPVDLTGTSVLRFRHAAQLSDDGDRALVELSLDDGASWVLLAEYHGDEHLGGADPADWSDAVLTPADWILEEFDLSAHAGERARIRFRRTSNSSGENLGWILDELFFGSPLDGRIHVAPDGDDLFGCGHPERPYATIAVGFANSAYGDTLCLAAGSYSETVDLELDGSPRPVNLAPPPGVSIRGEGMGESTVQIPGLGTGVYLGPLTGWSAADSALVEGLTLSGGSRGLRIEMGRARFRNTHCDAVGTGILVLGGELRADGLLLRACGRGARQTAGSFFLIGSTVVELERGIFVQTGADSTRVENCIFNRITRTALEVEASANPPVILCSDFHGFWGSPDVFLGIPDPIGFDGNVSVNPEFCDPFAPNYRLAQTSLLLDLPGCGPVGAFGEGCSTTAVDAPPLLESTRLLGNHPNPFNPRTRIDFRLARSGPVSLRLYDARGRLIRELWSGVLSAGEHAADWDATDARGRRVASGIYRVILRAEGRSFSASLVLLK